MKKPARIHGEGGDVVLYTGSGGSTSLEVRLDRETLWLSLKQIGTLFERDKSVISRHLSNVFKAGELERDSVVAVFATTATDRENGVEVEVLDLIDLAVWVKKRIRIDGQQRLTSGVTVSAHAARRAIAHSTRNGLCQPAV